MRPYGNPVRTQASKLTDALRFVTGCTDKAFAPQTVEKVASFYGLTRASDVEAVSKAIERRRAML